jgi:4-amino-4-deoxy-L-arabinose transferase-like glycosyltransferase
VQLGVWSAIAFLFRHDYLVYLAPPVAILILLGTRGWREALDRLAVYAATVVLLLAGPVFSIHHYVGLDSYLATARALVEQEANRTTFRWPQFGPEPGGLGAFFSNEGNAIAFLYDLSVAIPIVALLALIGSPRAKGLDTRQTRAVIASLAVLALLLDRFFLRNNLGARFGDLGAPLAILAAWLAWRFTSDSLPRRAVVWVVAAIVLLPTVQALGTTGSVRHELDTTGLSDSMKKIGRRLVAASADLRALPPSRVGPADPEPNAAEYVRQCTAPTDRILVVADAPEILALAGRPFAGGHPTFRPGFYTLDSDQRETLVRLRQQSVPVVLLDEEHSYTTHFVPQFRLIHEYVTTTYERAGELPAPAGPAVQVFTRRGHHAAQRYRTTDLPCFS